MFVIKAIIVDCGLVGLIYPQKLKYTTFWVK